MLWGEQVGRLRRKLERKIRSQGGFTLVEMLCAAVVLVFLGLVINLGIVMAVQDYHDVTVASEVELLASTLSNALLDDLRYAQDVKTDGGELTYDSDSFGEDVKFTLDPASSQLLVGDKRVLPPGAYRNGKYVLAALPEITYADGCFAVKFKVQEKNGDIFAEADFSVYCLNSAAPPAATP